MRTDRDLKYTSRELLNKAKLGNRSARKKLRHLGLRYWEHRGRVIMKRSETLHPEGMVPTRRPRVMSLVSTRVAARLPSVRRGRPLSRTALSSAPSR